MSRVFRGKCRTKHHIVLAYLWERETWVAAHELDKLDLPYGYLGNSGEVRARELARNDCPEELKNKVERKRGGEIGLDPRFAYYRFKQKGPTAEDLRVAREAVAAFDALPN